ncbi:hypothetical protein H8K47_17130 [Undibacterium sp. CY7W]|uniref:Uncharacterized protein n=1 Tax=Undibacterium rugosum TaxID=2762291 RepID=A0A923I4N2_9BURK|nr:hypothetical protein [Undibacterium rugosum]MBC3937082.1 hypothetical protein [Undibacterium rugosum]
MKPENTDAFDFDELFGNLDMSSARELTEDEWRDFAYFPREDSVTEEDYLIGYYDMGMFNEITVRARNEELAIDGFLCDYQPKGRYAPYIARCETMIRAKGRIAAGYTDLPYDGQTERFENFGNKYYEALNN